MKVKLIAITSPVIPECKTAEELISYCARVSSPQNQENHGTAARLLAYCIKNGHWSVFEQASFTVEIQTSRAIAQQILRHRSFSFQEFSQRYAVATEIEYPEMRKQGATNRQGGEELETDEHIQEMVNEAIQHSVDAYDALIKFGVAKECARFVLPLCTRTTLYKTGTVRSWIHYLKQRVDAHAQKEHREVAGEIQKIFIQNFPAISEALGWTL